MNKITLKLCRGKKTALEYNKHNTLHKLYWYFVTFEVGALVESLVHTAALESGPLEIHPRHVHTLDHCILGGGQRLYDEGHYYCKIQGVPFQTNYM